jgi:hypothetical protein
VTLLVSATLVVVLEGLRGSATLGTSAVWPLAQALVSGSALVAVWGSRDRLRLGPLLALALVFQVCWVAVHLRLGVSGDHDAVDVYPAQGNALLHGDYPRSEYPPGAVALFAVETWLGGGAARAANAFLMIPFQLACVASVWALRTRWTPWLAACLAFWPLNAFYWEFRFDLVPTAALVLGLVFASRQRWYEAGFVLGLGAIVKWTPALACLALVLWLVRSRRIDRAGAHLVGFAIPVLVANVPLLLWKPGDVLAAYTTQSARTVTAESFVYLPLRFFWSVRPGYWYFGAADVPPDANRSAVWFQIAAVAATMVFVVLARSRVSAIALAGLVPAVFLLTNRIFSPQFYVLVLAAIIVAAALVVRSSSELFAVAAACAVATTANTILFQSLLGTQPVATVAHWELLSAAAFLPTVTVVVWLIARAHLTDRAISTP